MERYVITEIEGNRVKAEQWNAAPRQAVCLEFHAYPAARAGVHEGGRANPDWGSNRTDKWQTNAMHDQGQVPRTIEKKRTWFEVVATRCAPYRPRASYPLERSQCSHPTSEMDGDGVCHCISCGTTWREGESIPRTYKPEGEQLL